jgi:hypothetical protein
LLRELDSYRHRLSGDSIQLRRNTQSDGT